MLVPVIWSDTDDRDEFAREMAGLEHELYRFFGNGRGKRAMPSFKTDVVDEGKDLKIQAELMGHLKEWSKEKGHTLLGVYHDINLALSVADRFIVMKEGTILYDGDEKALLEGDVLQEAYEMDVAAYMRDQYERWKTKGL